MQPAGKACNLQKHAAPTLKETPQEARVPVCQNSTINFILPRVPGCQSVARGPLVVCPGTICNALTFWHTDCLLN